MVLIQGFNPRFTTIPSSPYPIPCFFESSSPRFCVHDCMVRYALALSSLLFSSQAAQCAKPFADERLSESYVPSSPFPDAQRRAIRTGSSSYGRMGSFTSSRTIRPWFRLACFLISRRSSARPPAKKDCSGLHFLPTSARAVSSYVNYTTPSSNAPSGMKVVIARYSPFRRRIRTRPIQAAKGVSLRSKSRPPIITGTSSPSGRTVLCISA